MSGERTFFSGVKLNRLCEERPNPDSERKFLEDKAAQCVLFHKYAVAITEGKRLYISDLHSEAMGLIERDTLTFLGVQTSEVKAPMFAAQVKQEKVSELTALRPNVSFVPSVKTAALLTPDDGALLGYAKSMVRQHSVATFCPACGSKTEPQWIGTKRFCASCHQDIFTRTDPVSIVVVIHPTDPRKVLLVHKIGRPETFHSCVAGFVEPGETAEECACREVMEEAGVAVDISTLRFVATQPWPADIGSQLMIGFIGRATTEEITTDPNEIDHAQWYTEDEVRKALSGDKETTENVLALPGVSALAPKMLRIWLESLN